MKQRYHVWRQEQGAAPIAAIIVVLVIAAVVFVVLQIAPMQWARANFKEKVMSEMMYTLVPPYKNVDEKVRNMIVELLDEMGAEYKDEYIKIEVSDNNKRIHVEVWYSKAHNLPFYQNPKQFYVNLDHRAP